MKRAATVPNATMAHIMSSSLRNSAFCHLFGSMMNGKKDDMTINPIANIIANEANITFLFIPFFISCSNP